MQYELHRADQAKNITQKSTSTNWTGLQASLALQKQITSDSAISV